MRERILVPGELEAEAHEGGESSERERKQMVVGGEQEDGRYLGLQTSLVGGEQEDGRYLGLQTSSVVNSKIFGKMVRNLALKEKQGDASDLDKLAEVVMALADRVLKQEREIQELKQEVKDKEVSCKNAEKLLHQRVSGFDDMLHEHEKKLVALEQVVSASPSEHDGESERASVGGSAQQRISELEMKLVGQTKD